MDIVKILRKETETLIKADMPTSEKIENMFNLLMRQQLKIASLMTYKDIWDKFGDPYFEGLDNKTILELAKKSIRITAYNSELEDKIDNIREIALSNQTFEGDIENMAIPKSTKALQEIIKICEAENGNTGTLGTQKENS